MAIKLGQNVVTFPDGSTQSGRFDKTLDAKGELIQINSYPGSELHDTSACGTYTWTKPAGCTLVRVLVVGAGGGGTGHGGGGGAGGFAERWISSPSDTVTVTVGCRGAGNYHHHAAGNGSTSSFGSYVSASGGYGGCQNWGQSGGHGGVGHGGDINLYGGGGSGYDNRGSKGGMSFFGGSKFPGWSNNSHGETGENHYMAVGAGGSGTHSNHGRGSHGAGGAVIVYSYK